MPFTLSQAAFGSLAGLLVLIFALRALNVFGWFAAKMNKVKIVKAKKAIEEEETEKK